MEIAGAAAIRVIGAIAQESAEDAVLHVEHGHVLVNRYLEPASRNTLKELKQLLAIEIITGS
jgi:hypothetical protein